MCSFCSLEPVALGTMMLPDNATVKADKLPLPHIWGDEDFVLHPTSKYLNDWNQLGPK